MNHSIGFDYKVNLSSIAKKSSSFFQNSILYTKPKLKQFCSIKFLPNDRMHKTHTDCNGRKDVGTNELHTNEKVKIGWKSMTFKLSRASQIGGIQIRASTLVKPTLDFQLGLSLIAASSQIKEQNEKKNKLRGQSKKRTEIRRVTYGSWNEQINMQISYRIPNNPATAAYELNRRARQDYGGERWFGEKMGQI